MATEQKKAAMHRELRALSHYGGATFVERLDQLDEQARIWGGFEDDIGA